MLCNKWPNKEATTGWFCLVRTGTSARYLVLLKLQLHGLQLLGRDTNDVRIAHFLWSVARRCGGAPNSRWGAACRKRPLYRILWFENFEYFDFGIITMYCGIQFVSRRLYKRQKIACAQIRRVPCLSRASSAQEVSSRSVLDFLIDEGVLPSHLPVRQGAIEGESDEMNSVGDVPSRIACPCCNRRQGERAGCRRGYLGGAGAASAPARGLPDRVSLPWGAPKQLWHTGPARCVTYALCTATPRQFPAS